MRRWPAPPARGRPRTAALWRHRRREARPRPAPPGPARIPDPCPRAAGARAAPRPVHLRHSSQRDSEGVEARTRLAVRDSGGPVCLQRVARRARPRGIDAHTLYAGPQCREAGCDSEGRLGRRGRVCLPPSCRLAAGTAEPDPAVGTSPASRRREPARLVTSPLLAPLPRSRPSHSHSPAALGFFVYRRVSRLPVWPAPHAEIVAAITSLHYQVVSRPSHRSEASTLCGCGEQSDFGEHSVHFQRLYSHCPLSPSCYCNLAYFFNQLHAPDARDLTLAMYLLCGCKSFGMGLIKKTAEE